MPDPRLSSCETDRTRRDLLLSGAATIALTGLVPRIARAQARSVDDIVAQFQDEAGGLRDKLIETPPMPDMLRAQLGDLVSDHFDQRARLWRALDTVPEQELRDYALANYPTEFRLLEESLGPLVLPQEREIVPIRPVALPPQADNDPGEPAEDLSIVLMDVFLQAMGITLNRNALAAMVSADPELGALLDEILEDISTQDRDEVLSGLDKLLEKLVDGSLFAAFVRIFGEESARRFMRRMLGRVAASMFPFVGPVYLVLAIAISVWNNWDRLVEAT